MVTDFFDISEPVQEIRNAVGSVGSINNISECCNYPYQILDKFCASRTAVRFTGLAATIFILS